MKVTVGQTYQCRITIVIREPEIQIHLINEDEILKPAKVNKSEDDKNSISFYIYLENTSHNTLVILNSSEQITFHILF